MKRRHGRLFSLLFVVLAALLLLWADAASKNAAVSQLTGIRQLTVLPHLLSFQLLYNAGAAFGAMQGIALPLGVFAGVVLLVVLAYLLVVAKHSLLELCGFALFAAGVAGNALERLVKGTVTDFIKLDFIQFPNFNLADTFITCGVILLLICIVVGLLRSARKATKK
ncbi:MAG: signal peptidase II [Coriobacteriales bacterium]|jgi:signal peptidase II|nr:signal peptidase II [Coriobacteriales bacterium]